ncbi:MAG: single-stranded DNA-binding protein [Planctomycetaceae bacterium]|nr:single-stranded DNA-binding protein [Planctomycetaceae bacterium]
MASFNRVVLLGNLTRDPELRHIPSGLAVTEVSLAVNDRRKSQTGDWIEEVSYVDVTIWGRQAEIVCEYKTKGAPLLVEGRLKQDTWEQEGQKRSKLKVICEKMVLLPTGPGKGGNRGGGYDDGGDYSRPSRSSSNYSAPPQSQHDYYDTPPDSGDDVPF